MKPKEPQPTAIYEDLELWVDPKGDRHAEIHMTFTLPLPRKTQTLKYYLDLFSRAQWMHLRKYVQRWKTGLKALATAERGEAE